MKMTSVSYAAKSILLIKHTQNRFAKVSIARRQKIASQMNII